MGDTGVRRVVCRAVDPSPGADIPEYSGSGTIHDLIMMRFCWLGQAVDNCKMRTKVPGLQRPSRYCM